jgi:hypothetical protein
MTSKQLSVVKGYQKDYFEKFAKILEIDWLKMKGIDRSLETYKDSDVPYRDLEDILNDSVKKHNANLEIIKNRKRIDKQFPKERRALVEFARTVKANNLSILAAANLINKDRTMIYHYSYETKV